MHDRTCLACLRSAPPSQPLTPPLQEDGTTLPDSGCDAGARMMALCVGTLGRFALGVMAPKQPAYEVRGW